jgi:hypothetical protein
MAALGVIIVALGITVIVQALHDDAPPSTPVADTTVSPTVTPTVTPTPLRPPRAADRAPGTGRV